MQCLDRPDQRTGRVHDVVDDDAVTAFDVPDNIHDLGAVGIGSAFVHDGELGLEALHPVLALGCQLDHPVAVVGRGLGSDEHAGIVPVGMWGIAADAGSAYDGGNGFNNS